MRYSLPIATILLASKFAVVSCISTKKAGKTKTESESERCANSAPGAFHTGATCIVPDPITTKTESECRAVTGSKWIADTYSCIFPQQAADCPDNAKWNGVKCGGKIPSFYSECISSGNSGNTISKTYKAIMIKYELWEEKQSWEAGCNAATFRFFRDRIKPDHLDLSNSQISDLKPLGYMKFIKTMDLSENKITDPSPLSGLAIADLNLSRNAISAWGSIELPSLEELHLNHNKIQDPSSISKYSNLMVLDLQGNGISSIKNFANLQRLTRLDISDNNISDITALKRPMGHTFKLLDIRLNRISDFSPIEKGKGIPDYESHPQKKN